DPQHITTRAIRDVLKGMEKSSEISSSLIEEARAALAAIPDATQLTQDQLVAATKRGAVLEADLVELLMAQLPLDINKDARGLIEKALHVGVCACTATPKFREELSLGLVIDIARGTEANR